MDSNGFYMDWASHKAALYACQHWHYSGSIPMGKLIKIGAWEEGRFIGVVIFSRGSQRYLGRRYGLKQDECVELTRIAFREHKVPITKVVKIALSMLKKKAPGIRLVLSCANVAEGHYGIIYQAGNWIFEETTATGNKGYYLVDGKKIHNRSIGTKRKDVRVRNRIEDVRKYLDPNAVEIKAEGLRKYLMPLDKETRKRIAPLAKPYPRPPREGVISPGVHPGDGGASPTGGLKNSNNGDLKKEVLCEPT